MAVMSESLVEGVGGSCWDACHGAYQQDVSCAEGLSGCVAPRDDGEVPYYALRLEGEVVQTHWEEDYGVGWVGVTLGGGWENPMI